MIPDKMLAARFTPGAGLELEQAPVPEPGPHEVLMKVAACGICLSDVHLIDGSLPPVRDSVIPGHEAFGTVAATGDLVRGWSAGDRASMLGGRYCGECERCVSGRMTECSEFEVMGFHFDGAWAEYIAVPYYALARVPKGIGSARAAILADAVATPYAALSDRAGLKAGEKVGIWGIGGLGTHAVQIARLLGAGFIAAVDPLPAARERALALGADVALDPSAVDVRAEIKALTGGGVDVGVDFVGANAVLKQAVGSLARFGRAVIVGYSIERIELGPAILLGVQSQSILGHLGYSKKHLDDLVGLLASGRLDLSASISEVLPLADVGRGVEKLAQKIDDPVRIVIET